MYLQVMLFTGLTAHPLTMHYPAVARATFGIPDTLFLFVVALVVFGPKRLPEIGKQIGKLVFEFRRASNDFKLQIEEELRLAEQQDRQKKLDEQAAAKPVTPAIAAMQNAALAAENNTAPAETASDANGTTEGPTPPDRSPNQASGLSIQPPSTGTPVSALPPNHAAVAAEPAPPTDAPEIEASTPEAAAIPETTTAHTTVSHNG
jgi:sec-independent protein translocase protein TatB